jgi:hypothetical protein
MFISWPHADRRRWFRLYVSHFPKTSGAKSMNLSPNNLNPNVACAAHRDGSSSTAAKINRATLHKRAAIVDPNYH